MERSKRWLDGEETYGRRGPGRKCGVRERGRRMSWIRARRGMIGEEERKWDFIWIPEMRIQVKMPTSRAFWD